ncbi:hypothetical protein [Nitrosospira sp. Is2]|uniref:hypothetical protein n=1 Tax=Nitrosospira sp. Is2 TaxID=3080532 RepID=UPI0029553104|nr:hypothetical protein [Nitrosospira sp. Is2]WON74449.1 hypothetical protein R5L00_02865 [Nitrosospira sp. Is2]
MTISHNCCLTAAALVCVAVLSHSSPAAADDCKTPALQGTSDNYYGQRAVTLMFVFAEDCRDVVNIMWATPAGSWQQIEFEPYEDDFGTCTPFNRYCQANMTHGVGANPDKPYLFKVQSCRTRAIGPSACGDWSSVGHYLPWGPDTCIDGYVWREASDSDHVCVAPSSRDNARVDNAAAASRISPTDRTWGPNTCVQGFVWREAFPNDVVCVTPQIREQTRQENSVAWRNVARNWQ